VRQTFWLGFRLIRTPDQFGADWDAGAAMPTASRWRSKPFEGLLERCASELPRRRLNWRTRDRIARDSGRADTSRDLRSGSVDGVVPAMDQVGQVVCLRSLSGQTTLLRLPGRRPPCPPRASTTPTPTIDRDGDGS
jgi:hypothetical protein